MALQALALGLVGGTAALLLLLRLFSAEIYDVVIVWMTSRWYAAVFAKLRTGDRVLDVGIGTATALVRNKTLLLERHLSVVGIDYEAAYVRKAEAVLRAAGLWRAAPPDTEGYRPGEFYCHVLERSIYDPGMAALCTSLGCEDEAQGLHSSDPRWLDEGDLAVPPEGSADSATPVPEELRFDAAYFSGSLTVMPDPTEALKAVVPLLKSNGGRIFITQTFNKKKAPITAAVKPLLKYVTTIDFGQLTTEEDLNEIIARAGIFEVVENAPIEGSLDTPFQTARLIELRVKT